MSNLGAAFFPFLYNIAQAESVPGDVGKRPYAISQQIPRIRRAAGYKRLMKFIHRSVGHTEKKGQGQSPFPESWERLLMEECSPREATENKEQDSVGDFVQTDGSLHHRDILDPRQRKDRSRPENNGKLVCDNLAELHQFISQAPGR